MLNLLYFIRILLNYNSNKLITNTFKYSVIDTKTICNLFISNLGVLFLQNFLINSTYIFQSYRISILYSPFMTVYVRTLSQIRSCEK